MLGFSIGKLVVLFGIIFFVMKVFKSFQALNARKYAKSNQATQKDDDVVDLKKDKDGKYK